MIEVAVEAPRERVWRAFTDPDELRSWFGWEHDDLDEEIQFIFFEHAAPLPPDRIRFEDGGDGQLLELVEDGSRTLVRIAPPEALAEGWRAFFEQLRYRLEREPEGARRTVHLGGEGTPAEVVGAVEERASEVWHAGARQRGLLLDGGGLAIVAAAEPLDSEAPCRVTVTVTRYGIDDAAIAELRRQWEKLPIRWSG